MHEKFKKNPKKPTLSTQIEMLSLLESRISKQEEEIKKIQKKNDFSKRKINDLNEKYSQINREIKVNKIYSLLSSKNLYENRNLHKFNSNDNDKNNENNLIINNDLQNNITEEDYLIIFDFYKKLESYVFNTNKSLLLNNKTSSSSDLESIINIYFSSIDFDSDEFIQFSDFKKLVFDTIFLKDSKGKSFEYSQSHIGNHIESQLQFDLIIEKSPFNLSQKLSRANEINSKQPLKTITKHYFDLLSIRQYKEIIIYNEIAFYLVSTKKTIEDLMIIIMMHSVKDNPSLILTNNLPVILGINFNQKEFLGKEGNNYFKVLPEDFCVLGEYVFIKDFMEIVKKYYDKYYYIRSEFNEKYKIYRMDKGNRQFYSRGDCKGEDLSIYENNCEKTEKVLIDKSKSRSDSFVVDNEKFVINENEENEENEENDENTSNFNREFAFIDNTNNDQTNNNHINTKDKSITPIINDDHSSITFRTIPNEPNSETEIKKSYGEIKIQIESLYNINTFNPTNRDTNKTKQNQSNPNKSYVLICKTPSSIIKSKPVSTKLVFVNKEEQAINLPFNWAFRFPLLKKTSQIHEKTVKFSLKFELFEDESQIGKAVCQIEIDAENDFKKTKFRLKKVVFQKELFFLRLFYKCLSINDKECFYDSNGEFILSPQQFLSENQILSRVEMKNKENKPILSVIQEKKQSQIENLIREGVLIYIKKEIYLKINQISYKNNENNDNSNDNISKRIIISVLYSNEICSENEIPFNSINDMSKFPILCNSFKIDVDENEKKVKFRVELEIFESNHEKEGYFDEIYIENQENQEKNQEISRKKSIFQKKDLNNHILYNEIKVDYEIIQISSQLHKENMLNEANEVIN